MTPPLARVSIVVPTLGRSPLLGECLRALRAEAATLVRPAGEWSVELIVVAQGNVEAPDGGAPGLAERTGELWLRAERPLGFAGAVNRGIDAATAPYVAVVNDDAVIEPDWLSGLTAALDGDPGAASAQGLNLIGSAPRGARAERPRIDGRGLEWNRWLQAVQIDHGEPVRGLEGAPREVFGVSATAALYRREALLAVAFDRGDGPGSDAGPPLEVFDSRLGTYYEDADLALRLRAAGHRALSVGSARAWHGGSFTAGDGVGRWRRVHGNRYLVVARALGRSFWRRLPRMVARDLVDLASFLTTGRWRRAGGVVAGWGRAVRRLPRFAHGGPPTMEAG